MNIIIHTKHELPEHVYQLAQAVGQVEARSAYHAEAPLICAMRAQGWTVAMRGRDSIKQEVHLYLSPITNN